MPQTKIIFTQIPVSLADSDYKKARKWIVEFFHTNKDILAVYEYGIVNNPGLSDLDLMVVLQDKPRRQGLYSRLTFKDVPHQLSSMVNNSSIKLINRKHFQDINWLGPFRNKLLYGEEIEFSHIPKQDRQLINLASVMDFLPERILSLQDLRRGKKLPVLDLIGFFQSYLYSARGAERILERGIAEIDTFAAEVKDIRQGWFKKEPAEQMKSLSRLMESGISSGVRLIQELASAPQVRRHYRPLKFEKKTLFYFNRRKGFYFSADRKNIDKGPALLLLVPDIWLSHFYCYGQPQGIISYKIRQNIICQEKLGSLNMSKEMSAVLRRRIGLCNEMAAYFVRYGIPLNKLYRFAHIKNNKK